MKKPNDIIKKLKEDSQETCGEGLSGYYYRLDEDKFAKYIVKLCAYYAEIYHTLGCPVDKDPYEYTIGVFIREQFNMNDETPSEQSLFEKVLVENEKLKSMLKESLHWVAFGYSQGYLAAEELGRNIENVLNKER